MTKHAEFLKTVESHARAWGAKTRGVNTYLGNPQASVMIVGWMLCEHERSPFSYPSSVRDALASMKVTPPMVFLTNLIKYWLPTPLVADWREYLIVEAKIIKPKAIVCLGEKVANCVIGGDENIEAMRRFQLGTSRIPGVPCFVTYSPEELVAASTVEFTSDLRAVFEVNRNYFKVKS